jgi:hypothetical protein
MGKTKTAIIETCKETNSYVQHKRENGCPMKNFLLFASAFLCDSNFSLMVAVNK